MRRRLLAVTLAVIAAALLAFALPLALAVRGQLADQALDELQGEVSQVATFVEDRARTCGEARLWLTIAARTGIDVALFDRSGELLFAAGQAPLTAVPVDVAAAAQGGVGRARAGERLGVSVPLASQVCGVPLVLHGSASAGPLDASTRRSWLAIAGVGAAALAGAGLVARVVGARLTRPLEALATSARRLGDGDFSTRAPRSGLPEPDEIAEALDVTADRLGHAVARGTAFTADASHQLRTPLTALRLHLEGLEGAGADPTAVADALAEADRLDATIRELVSLTRLDGPTGDLDLAGLLLEREDGWRSRAERRGRELVVEAGEAVIVRARAAAVSQAVEVLVDNALEHGAGTVTIACVDLGSPEGDPGGARVCVHDRGAGAPPHRLPASSSRDRGVRETGGEDLPVRGGRGLVLARSLVAGEGGRLVFEPADDGWRACIVLAGHPGPTDGRDDLT